MFKNLTLIRQHTYENENGSQVAVKSIYKTAEGKTAYWHRITPTGPVKGLTDEIKAQIPLYHIPQLLHCFDDVRMLEQPLFFAEGEKDCETLENLGYIATTTRNGGGSFPKWEEIQRYISKFSTIFVLTDNDKTGQIYGINAIKHFTGKINDVFIIDTVDIFEEIPLDIKKTDVLQEHADISDLVTQYGSEITNTALKSIVNARYRFGNTNPIYDYKPEQPKKIKAEKKKAERQAEKESEKQNALFLKIMNELCKMPFTWRLSSPWLYENGIYCEFNLKKFISDKSLQDFLTPKTIEKIKLNLEIHALRLKPQVFDHLICLKDNVYDFIRNEYEPHNKQYLFTYQFDKIGNRNAVRTFLGAFCDESEKVGYFLGSCFFAHNEPEKCLFLIGDIGTGKSTLARCIAELFPENTSYINLAKNYVDRFELFGLVDSWLNVMDDVYVNQHNFLHMQSLISGKVSVSTERKYGDPFTFKPRTKFLYTTNFDPIFSRECEGMKRRALFVHTKKLENPPPIPPVADWLAYGLEYAQKLHKLKFKVPYAEEVVIYNPIKDFLEICKFPCPASEFYNSFVAFCHAEHGGLDKRFTSAVFYNEAKKCGFERKLIKKEGQVIRFWIKNE